MIFFLHIPKTAGTTLSTVFKIQYREHEIYPWDNIKFHQKIEEFKNMAKDDPRKTGAKLLKGHFPFGLHEYVNGDSRYLTFVRDPQKRLVSHLIQFSRMPNSHIRKDYLSGLTTLEILKKYSFFKNGQVNWISGLNKENGLSDKYKLDVAIKNIENHFAFVGITERFEESLLLMREVLNWKFPPFYSSFNVSKKHEKNQMHLDKATLSLIEEMNQYDHMLYNYCLDRFEDNLSKVSINLSTYHRQLLIFQKAHKFYLSTKKLFLSK